MTFPINLEPIYQWFKSKRWTPWPFQIEVWEKSIQGKSGLLSVPTGSGKTYAAYLGALADIHQKGETGLQILYITPLRALTRDIESALKLPVSDLGWDIRIESRTGDTQGYQRVKQLKKSPHVLLTTPESLSILQSYPEHKKYFSKLKYVIVDEWHELCGNKRGVLLELSLAHLRSFLPDLRIWVLSATLGNLQEAAHAALGNLKPFEVIVTELKRPVIVHSVLPKTLNALPWAGFLGIQMLPYLLDVLDPLHTTMIFTNTRSQAERWFQAIASERPEWKNLMALHHSAIDKKVRYSAEDGIKSGELSFIISTSSLDLGIDFPNVEKVVQIGSCKSIARIIQRAGRASHSPMKPSNIYMVPSHALEIAEIIAVKEALAEKSIDSRIPLKMSYDVLFQHLTTLAVGGGFEKKKVFDALKSTYAFSPLTVEEFENILEHLENGGKSLLAYPDYQKLVLEGSLYVVNKRDIAIRHRMNIGTITSDTHVHLKQLTGKSLGNIEEQFIAKLQKGDAFMFGGKTYELVQMADLVAIVRASKKKEVSVPIWLGSTLPISPSLAYYVRQAFNDFNQTHHTNDLESTLFNEICKIQNKFSVVPKIGECLVEIVKTKEGWHYLFYPFEGKGIHDALSSIVAYRLSRKQKGSFLLSATDYGFEVFSSKKLTIDSQIIRELFTLDNLKADIDASHNITELAKSRFRDIARIGGLVFSGYPHKRKTFRQIQISSSILFDVFLKYDPDHLLLKQSFQEVYNDYFHEESLNALLSKLSKMDFVIKEVERMTPLGLPLFASAMWGKIAPEDLAQRIKEMSTKWN